jgi:transposase
MPVPAALTKFITLHSNGPAGAINGRPHHLRRSTLGYRNLTH